MMIVLLLMLLADAVAAPHFSGESPISVYTVLGFIATWVTFAIGLWRFNRERNLDEELRVRRMVTLLLTEPQYQNQLIALFNSFQRSDEGKKVANDIRAAFLQTKDAEDSIWRIVERRVGACIKVHDESAFAHSVKMDAIRAFAQAEAATVKQYAGDKIHAHDKDEAAHVAALKRYPNMDQFNGAIESLRKDFGYLQRDVSELRNDLKDDREREEEALLDLRREFRKDLRNVKQMLILLGQGRSEQLQAFVVENEDEIGESSAIRRRP